MNDPTPYDTPAGVLMRPGQIEEDEITEAISHLRVARDLLKGAGAPRAAEKVRAAINSAEGARRNARVRAYRAREDEA